MNIDLGKKCQQIQCCKCGQNWVVAKGQQIGVKASGYVCPWCSAKNQKGAERCRETEKRKHWLWRP